MQINLMMVDWSKLKSFEGPQAYDDFVANAEDEIP